MFAFWVLPQKTAQNASLFRRQCIRYHLVGLQTVVFLFKCIWLYQFIYDWWVAVGMNGGCEWKSHPALRRETEKPQKLNTRNCHTFARETAASDIWRFMHVEHDVEQNDGKRISLKMLPNKFPNFSINSSLCICFGIYTKRLKMLSRALFDLNTYMRVRSSSVENHANTPSWCEHRHEFV